jgi:hypothetical protein
LHDYYFDTLSPRSHRRSHKEKMIEASQSMF